MTAFGMLPRWVVTKRFLARMTPGGAKVFIAIIARRDGRSGDTHVAFDTLADEAGVARTSMTVIIKHLESLSCEGRPLLTVRRGRYRTDVSRFHVDLAGGDDISPKKGSAHAGLSEEKGSAGAALSAQKGSAAPQKGQHRRGLIHNGTKNNTATGVVENHFSEGNGDVLRRIGLTGEAVNQLARLPGLTPLGIALLGVEAGPTVRNLPGWLRSRLEGGARGPERAWGPPEVCAAIRRDWLGELDGHAVKGRRVTQNGQGIYLRNGQEAVATITLSRLRELAGAPP